MILEGYLTQNKVETGTMYEWKQEQYRLHKRMISFKVKNKQEHKEKKKTNK